LQNGGYGESFAALTLEFDENGDLKDTDGKLINPNRYENQGLLTHVFQKYEEHMAIGDTVLLNIDESISRYDVGISVAHSMYLKYNTDFAVINSGGVRTSIEAGDVTYADLFQVLPFENEVYIVTLSGAEMREYLMRNSSAIYYWGIDIYSLEDSQSYTMAIVDFVYLGYYFEDYRNDSCIDTNDLIRDVFIDFVKENAG
jgi:2',3'-cyclic-nucleotide 2'-phosphodiesterase (5'-nucleotidase family)